MNNGLKRFLSIVLSTVMVVSSITFAGIIPVSAASAVEIYTCQGVQEAAYVEWAAVSGTDHYYVSYSKDGSNFTQIDDELIRKYPDRWRADLIGLSAGNYTVKVTCKDASNNVITEATQNCTVVAQDRTGFTFSPKSLRYDNGGCGAYNADGTLKSGATVLYITDKNFDTVTLKLKDKAGNDYTATGLAEITKTMGDAAAKGNSNPPLAVRFLGTIGENHNGLASPNILETKSNGNYAVNITFEGVGEDTIFNGLGLRLNGVANCEIRNIAFWNWHDDAIQLQGNENSNHWIHNNDLFYGENHGGDQKKGDGSTDIKDDSRYVTYSYNHYWDSGKTSLCGMKGESGDNYITYHHNWFDHSDSRHPRIRTMFVHVYNNYYDGNAKYGVGAALNSSAFVEGNYFRNCKHPMLTSKQGSDIMENSKTGVPDFSAKGTFSSENGGVIKAYNNYIEGSDADKFNGGYEPVYYDAADTKTNGKATQFDAYLAKSRDEQVPSSVKALQGGKTFNNANVDDYILSIPVQEPEDAKNKAVAYSGRTGDDFLFTFNNAVDDKDYEINTALAAAVAAYVADTSDDYVSIGGASDGSGPVSTSSTTTEATTEATTTEIKTEDNTETTTEKTPEPTTYSTPVEIGEAETGFASDDTSDTGSGISVTFDEETDRWMLKDTSKSAAAEVTIPFAEQTSGKIIISGTAEPSTTASKWAFVQIRGTKADGTPSEIIGFGGGTNKADLSVRVNGAATYTKLGTLAAKNYEYTIVMDLDNKTAEVTVDGITQSFNVDVASINALYSTTSKTQVRNVTISIPYVGVLGDEHDSTTEATTEITTVVTTETTTASTTETTETTTREVTTEATSETTTEIVPPTPGIVYGDVDGNGKREISDVVLLIAQIRKGSVEPVPGINDVTMDGKVDTADVATILQKILNDSYKMPCEPDDEETTEGTTEITTDKTTVVTTEITTETTTEIATETTTVDNISADRMEGDIVSDGVNLASGAYFDGQLIIADNNDAAWTSKAQIPVMTIGNRTYSTFVQGAGNPKSADGKQSYNAQGKLVIPEQGAYIKVVPTSDATLMIDYKVAAGKQFAIMSVDAAGNKTEIVYKSPSDDEYYSEQYALTAGNTYYVTSAGTKTCFYGIALINSLAPVITTEATTEITTVVTTEGTTEDTSSEPIDKISTGVPMAKDKITLYGDESFKAEILKGSSDEIVANALYVSPTGSDSNTGTASAPFKTVQKALDTVKAGQTIYLREGTYTALNTFKSSGIEGNYITLRNYPGEKPYLTMTAGSSGAILRLDGNDYIKIEGLEIGGLSSDIAQGILLDGNENHVIIRNNDIHNLVTTKPGENDNGEANAILCYGEGKTEEDSINNICIENNLVHNNTTGWCESVSVTGNAKYVNIINNTVYDNTNIGIDFYGNAGYCSIPSLDQPRYCVAAGNVIYGSICGYAECAGLYVDGARDIVLENNISHDNMYGIEIGSEELQADYLVKNIIARNNLVYNNSAGGIRVGGYDRNKTGYVTDTKIYNNTVVNNGEGEGGWNGELCFVKCDGVDVRNNIVYKDNKNYPMIGGDLAKEYVKNVTFSNNVFYNPLGAEEIYFEFAKGSAEGIAAFNEQTGGNDTFGKPDFNADYSLKAGSYGIDAGADVSNDMGTLTDLANNGRIINTIDLGAFEYQG